jgi:hypothetical protein
MATQNWNVTAPYGYQPFTGTVPPVLGSGANSPAPLAPPVNPQAAGAFLPVRPDGSNSGYGGFTGRQGGNFGPLTGQTVQQFLNNPVPTVVSSEQANPPMAYNQVLVAGVPPPPTALTRLMHWNRAAGAIKNPVKRLFTRPATSQTTP